MDQRAGNTSQKIHFKEELCRISCIKDLCSFKSSLCQRYIQQMKVTISSSISSICSVLGIGQFCRFGFHGGSWLYHITREKEHFVHITMQTL